MVSLKSGLDLINTYYSITDGKETRLFSPGVYTDDHLTTVVEGDLMTWAESRFHERWINKDYSVIMRYDFSTGKVSQLTSRTKYFSPAPSKDGNRIIVSETDTKLRYTLILLDARTGDALKRLPNPDNNFFTHMRWVDNQYVVAIMLNEKGNALVQINTEGGQVTKLIP